MIELPLNEQQLRNITKNYPGIRYKYDKQGRFTAYTNAWTLIVDGFKFVINKICAYKKFEKCDL